jgi:hypothetical protein
MIERRVVVPGKNLPQPGYTEHLFFGVHGFGDAIAKENQCVAWLQLHARRHVIGSRDETYRERAFGERLNNLTGAKEKRRGMARINELQVTGVINYSKKYCGIPSDFGMLAKEIVDVLEHTRRVGTNRHSRKRTLKHGGQQGGAEAFAGNVRHQKCGTTVTEWKNVEVVSPNSKAW